MNGWIIEQDTSELKIGDYEDISEDAARMLDREAKNRKKYRKQL